MGNLARLPRILQASRQPVRRFRRRSTSWNSRRPPSADVHRSSMMAEIGLSPIGDRLGRTSVSCSRWVGAPGARIGVDNQILRPLKGSRHTHRLPDTPPAFVNNPGSGRQAGTSWIVRSTLPGVDRSFREMPLELLEDRGGAGIGFGILLPHGSHQEASQSLPLLLRQMGAQDPTGLGHQSVRVKANRAYGGLTHRRTFYEGPSWMGQPPPEPHRVRSGEPG